MFVKQLGSNVADCDANMALVQLKLRSKKGGDPTEWADDLRVREYPVVA